METDFLNDIEREKITYFLKDGVLCEAVRKVFLKRIFSDGVLKPGLPHNPYENFALNIYKSGYAPYETKEMYTDEELGKLTKVRRMAIELVQIGFTDLEKYRKIEPKEEKKDSPKVPR